MTLAVTTFVMLSIMHTTHSQCTTSTCAESSRESRTDSTAPHIQSLMDGVAEILQEVATAKKELHALEASFNSRLGSIETKLSSQIEDVLDVCKDPSMIFLRRQDGSVNFTRSWSEYRDGFGDPDGEFWLGLTALHRLTSQRRYRLRVDLLDWSGETKWAEYDHFGVGSESDKFQLSISSYDVLSTAGDSMTGSHSYNGMAFTTYDRDNDLQSSYNCAAELGGGGGWWFRSCGYAWPTGLYKPAEYRGRDGIRWIKAYGDNRSFKAVTLKLVPV